MSIKNSFESLFYTMSFFVGALMRWGHIFLFYVSAKIILFFKISQPALHVFQHIAAKQPRVGEVEVAFGEHGFVGRDENHFRVKVGADGSVMVEISSGRTRNNQNAVASIVVFGHAKMELCRDGVGFHGPDCRVDTQCIAT